MIKISAKERERERESICESARLSNDRERKEKTAQTCCDQLQNEREREREKHQFLRDPQQLFVFANLEFIKQCINIGHLLFKLIFDVGFIG